MESIGGDGSKTGLVMKKGKNRRPVSVPASPRGKGREQQRLCSDLLINFCSTQLTTFSIDNLEAGTNSVLFFCCFT